MANVGAILRQRAHKVESRMGVKMDRTTKRLLWNFIEGAEDHSRLNELSGNQRTLAIAICADSIAYRISEADKTLSVVAQLKTALQVRLTLLEAL